MRTLICSFLTTAQQTGTKTDDGRNVHSLYSAVFGNVAALRKISFAVPRASVITAIFKNIFQKSFYSFAAATPPPTTAVLLGPNTALISYDVGVMIRLSQKVHWLVKTVRARRCMRKVMLYGRCVGHPGICLLTIGLNRFDVSSAANAFNRADWGSVGFRSTNHL